MQKMCHDKTYDETFEKKKNVFLDVQKENLFVLLCSDWGSG